MKRMIKLHKREKEKNKGKKFFKRRWVKIAVRTVIVLLLVLAVAAFVRFKLSRRAQPAEVQTTSEVIRGDIYVSVTGSGTVSPIESYTLSPLITGKILECGFDKGESVQEGDILYRFEDTEIQAKIKAAENAVKSARLDVLRAEKNIEDAKEDIKEAKEDISEVEERMEKLTVKAPISGMVEDFDAKEGDKLSGSLCKITDYNDISATVMFNAAQYGRINVGDRVSVGIARLMTSVGGYVSKKYTAPRAAADGSVMYAVKIQLDDGLNIAAGTTVSVSVHTAEGEVECPSAGTVVYAEPKDVTLEEGGEVVSVRAESGNYVEKGAVLAVLKSESLETELKNANKAYQNNIDALSNAQDAYENSLSALENAQSDLETTKKEAENYTIISPVTGVVLEKYYKAGDTYGNDDEKRLMVVADMSKMVFSINVDELDISSLSEGQAVSVTADALPGEFMSGTVTSVSGIGNSENGVTGYPVEITIDEPGKLMSGMNVTAEISVGSAEGVLLAPASAIFQTDGIYFASVVTESADGTLETAQTEISVGLHNSEFYEILSGLDEGDILSDSGIAPDTGNDEYYYYG